MMAIYHYCSDGRRVSQSTIDRKYAQARKEKHIFSPIGVCECCGKKPAIDNDHTIAQARCKQIHKTELIWNPLCFVSSCRNCHMDWERFKNGNWINHKNVEQRLRFLKEHDPEGYNKRIELTKMSLENG